MRNGDDTYIRRFMFPVLSSSFAAAHGSDLPYVRNFFFPLLIVECQVGVVAIYFVVSLQ